MQKKMQVYYHVPRYVMDIVNGRLVHKTQRVGLQKCSCSSANNSCIHFQSTESANTYIELVTNVHIVRTIHFFSSKKQALLNALCLIATTSMTEFTLSCNCRMPLQLAMYSQLIIPLLAACSYYISIHAMNCQKLANY